MVPSVDSLGVDVAALLAALDADVVSAPPVVVALSALPEVTLAASSSSSLHAAATTTNAATESAASAFDRACCMEHSFPLRSRPSSRLVHDRFPSGRRRATRFVNRSV